MKGVGSLLSPRRIAVARQVKPVAAPLLAIAGRGEQLVDEFFKSIRGWIVDELLDLLGRGRQSVKVQVSAANEGSAVCFARRIQLLLTQLFRNERIDGRMNPCVLRFRNYGLHRLPE